MNSRSSHLFAYMFLPFRLAAALFNPAVEAGQILFILSLYAVAAGLRRIARRVVLRRREWMWRVPPCAMKGVAAF